MIFRQLGALGLGPLVDQYLSQPSQSLESLRTQWSLHRPEKPPKSTKFISRIADALSYTTKFNLGGADSPPLLINQSPEILTSAKDELDLLGDRVIRALQACSSKHAPPIDPYTPTNNQDARICDPPTNINEDNRVFSDRGDLPAAEETGKMTEKSGMEVLKDAAEEYLSILSLILSLPRSASRLDTRTQSTVHLITFYLLTPMVYTLCIVAQSCRSNRTMFVRLLRIFQINQFMSKVCVLIASLERLPNHMTQVTVAELVQPPSVLGKDCTVPLASFDTAEAADFVSCLATFLKSVCQTVTTDTYALLVDVKGSGKKIEKDRNSAEKGSVGLESQPGSQLSETGLANEKGVANEKVTSSSKKKLLCPVWRVLTILLTFPDGMVRTHVFSALLALMKVLPTEVVARLCFEDSAFSLAIDRALRLHAWAIDVPIVTRRAWPTGVCMCFDSDDAVDLATLHTRPCRSCQDLGHTLKLTLDDLDDLLGFIQDVFDTPPFAEDETDDDSDHYDNPTRQESGEQGLTETTPVNTGVSQNRKVMTSRVPGTSGENRAALMCVLLERFLLPLCVRSLTSHQLSGRRAKKAAAPRSSHSVHSLNRRSRGGSSTSTTATKNGSEPGRVRRGSAGGSGGLTLAGLDADAVLDPVTARLVLDRVLNGLRESPLTVLTHLLIAAPAVPAFLLAHIFSVPFLRLMTRLHGPPHCCCCAAALPWPPARWLADPGCDTLTHILLRLSATARAAGALLGDTDKKDPLRHYGHLIRNPVRAIRMNTWNKSNDRLGAQNRQVHDQQALSDGRHFLIDLMKVSSMVEHGVGFTAKFLSVCKLMPNVWRTVEDFERSRASSSSGLVSSSSGLASYISEPAEPDDPTSYFTACLNEVKTSADFCSLEVDMVDPSEAERHVVETLGRHIHRLTAAVAGEGKVRIKFPREDIDELETLWLLWSSLFCGSTLSRVELKLIQRLLPWFASLSDSGEFIDELAARRSQLLLFWHDQLCFFSVSLPEIDKAMQHGGATDLAYAFAGRGDTETPSMTLHESLAHLNSNCDDFVTVQRALFVSVVFLREFKIAYSRFTASQQTEQDFNYDTIAHILTYDNIVRRRCDGASSRTMLLKLMEILHLLDLCSSSPSILDQIGDLLKSPDPPEVNSKLRILYLNPISEANIYYHDIVTGAEERSKNIIPCDIVLRTTNQYGRTFETTETRLFMSTHGGYLVIFSPDADLLGYGVVRHTVSLEEILLLPSGVNEIQLLYDTRKQQNRVERLRFDSARWHSAAWQFLFQHTKITSKIQDIFGLLIGA